MKYLTLLSTIGIFFLISCYKEKNHSESNIKNYDTTVRIFIDPVAIPADSFTFSKITIELPYDADSLKSSVQLRTDLGTFIESNNQTIVLQAKQNSDSLKRMAIATLRSGTRTGTAHIQYSIQTQIGNLTDSFYNSYPDYFVFSASTLSVKPSNTAAGEVNFTCRLLKQTGFPSQLNNVTLKVVDSNYNDIGLFRYYNNLSDPSATTQYIYVLGDSVVNKRNYIGRLYAIVSTSKDQFQTPLGDTLTLVSSK